MLAKDVIKKIYELAPVYLIDSWDNSGLQIGRQDKEVNKILLSLDLTYEVVKEAVEQNVDMIVTHHPVFFEKIRSLIPNNDKGKAIYDIIKNDITVFSAHTNLDTCIGGVNDVLAELFRLKDISVLEKTYEEKLYKLVVYVPNDYCDKVRDAITSKGAGWIGNYSHCTYNVKGIGTFMPREGTNPFIGKVNNVEEVEETRIETIVRENILDDVINEMLATHPYEEVAYDIFPLVNSGRVLGNGRIGNLEKATDLKTFAEDIKVMLNTSYVRVYGDLHRQISRVAVCGGSGGDLIELAKRKGADVYITGDIKYHKAQLAKELDIALIDANHYDTEKIILPRIKGYLKKVLGEFIEILICDINSAPFTVL